VSEKKKEHPSVDVGVPLLQEVCDVWRNLRKLGLRDDEIRGALQPLIGAIKTVA
jgi:hypothetical protein